MDESRIRVRLEPPQTGSVTFRLLKYRDRDFCYRFVVILLVQPTRKQVFDTYNAFISRY